jgi:hypothetical protein
LNLRHQADERPRRIGRSAARDACSYALESGAGVEPDSFSTKAGARPAPFSVKSPSLMQWRRLNKKPPAPSQARPALIGRGRLRIVAGFPMLGEVEALIFLVTVYSQADRCVDDFQQDDTDHAGQQDGID